MECPLRVGFKSGWVSSGWMGGWRATPHNGQPFLQFQYPFMQCYLQKCHRVASPKSPERSSIYTPLLHSSFHIILLAFFLFVTFYHCYFPGSFFRGIPIGPCTIHPHMLLLPRDSGVNSLPLDTEPPRIHGLQYGFCRALSAYCPDS